MLRIAAVFQSSFKHSGFGEWLQCSGFFSERGVSTRFFPVAVGPMLQGQHCWGAVMISVFKECETT